MDFDKPFFHLKLTKSPLNTINKNKKKTYNINKK